MLTALAGFALLASGIALIVWFYLRALRRAEFIRAYSFPKGLYDKFAARRAELERKDFALVARGLRQFFLAYLKSGRRFVSMPSQAADDLWHEFILYTKNYEQFCAKAFGGFLHHSPAAVLTPAQQQGNEGLRRVWWHACKEENINPARPTRLPLLFALDAKLRIAGGFVYLANCAALRASSSGATTYCGGDFSSNSIDGSTSGFGAGEGGGGGEGGAGDSGGGCGGGGCGGGD